jgi:AcrR family transcriptional regulator
VPTDPTSTTGSLAPSPNPTNAGSASAAPSHAAGARSRPRRSPAPEERQQNADRSRQCLLGAALDEFAAKGFAGARVQEIAARAGVNKQLINYYFGGKEGLYRELQSRWLRDKSDISDRELPLPELATHYLHGIRADPRGARLAVWQDLTDPDGELSPDPGDTDGAAGVENLDRLAARQARGEIAADLDAQCVMLALISAVSAPAVLPHLVRRVGLDPTDPGFEARYGAALRQIIERLGATPEDRPDSLGP